MKEYKEISESEYEVMEVIWDKNDWADISYIHETLSKVRAWAYNTVGTFLVRLCDKGFLKTEKRGRSNFYYPLLTKDEYISEQTKRFLKTVHSGSKKSLIASLYRDELSENEIKKLMDWVDKH